VKGRIVWFPGLGADARLARFHDGVGIPCVWQEWLTVGEEEKFGEYAERMGASAGVRAEDWVAGVSFGGTVALAWARRHPVRGVILVGSPRSAVDVAWPLRAAAAAGGLNAVPAWMVDERKVPRALLRWWFGVRTPEECDLLLEMAQSVGAERMRRLCRMALSVEEEVRADVPVLSLHGTEDRIVPFRADRGHIPVEGAGHMVSITHADAVNGHIRRFMCG
jgi:pimeloyl-ACP methyl ester carboxylesterase